MLTASKDLQTEDNGAAGVQIAAPLVLVSRGGSGSRLLSIIAAEAGVFLGNTLNVSGDSMEMVPAIYRAVIAKNGDTTALSLPDAAAALQRAAFEMREAAGFPTRWGFKLPEAILILPEIMAAFPEARFVHLIRDPATTCLRRTHLTGRLDNEIGRVTIPLAYRYHNLPLSQIEQDSPALHMAYTTQHQLSGALETLEALPPSRCLELRFEEMLSSPREMNRVFREWLDPEAPAAASATPSMLEQTVDARRAREPSVRYPPEIEAQVVAILAELRTRLGYLR